MIKSRITDQEVRELVNSLDNRLTQEQELLKRHVAERRNRQTQEYDKKIKDISDFVDQKNKDNVKLQEVFKQHMNIYCTVEQFNESQKGQSS